MTINKINTIIDDLLKKQHSDIQRLTTLKSVHQFGDWKCKKCKFIWTAHVTNIQYHSSDCPRCVGKEKTSNNSVDLWLSKNQPTIIRLGTVINSQLPILFKCVKCTHEWKTRPTKILATGTKCPKCSNRIKLTNKEVDVRLLEKQLNIKRLDEYVNTNTKLKWQCLQCSGVWYARPANIFNFHTGCPHCRTPSYSKKSIRWLTFIEKQSKIIIQHAESGKGEYMIPSTELKVDGYCKETNTVYEFYGDIWHGNPEKFKANEKCNPYHKKTAGQLFQQTIDKETKIKKLGYNLVTIWESEYDKQFKKLTSRIL